MKFITEFIRAASSKDVSSHNCFAPDFEKVERGGVGGGGGGGWGVHITFKNIGMINKLTIGGVQLSSYISLTVYVDTIYGLKV